MKWLINNKYRNHSDNKYRIKWDRKAPSKGAQIVKDFLFQNCRNHVLFEEYRLPSSRLYCDWIDATLKLCLEYDDKEETGHHNHFNKFFHKTRLGYLNSIKRDIKKDQILELNGYKVVRIFEEDLPLTIQWFEKQGIYL